MRNEKTKQNKKTDDKQDSKKIIMNANLTFPEMMDIFNTWLEKNGLTSLVQFIEKNEQNIYVSVDSTHTNYSSTIVDVSDPISTTITDTNLTLFNEDEKSRLIGNLKTITKKLQKLTSAAESMKNFNEN